MSATLRRALRHLTAPRRLVALAAIVAGMGFVAGYVDSQYRAERVLALRQGPPPAVSIQNFRANRDTGPAGEVTVLAEIEMSRGVILAPGDATDPVRAWAAPLYPLSAEGAARVAAKRRGGGTVPAQVARRSLSESPKPPPLGYVLLPLRAGAPAPEAPGDVASESFGRGGHGHTVMLNGRISPDPRFAPLAVAALAALPDNPVVVSPWPGGRADALSRPSGSRHELVYSLAFLILFAAAAEALRRGLVDRGRPAEASRTGDAPESSHPFFAPLTSQDEIARAEREQDEAAHPALQTRLSALLNRLRNRPKPPGA